MNFWADELAERAIARHGGPYVVSDWKTPSGRIHVGSLRGVLVNDVVARTIRAHGQTVRNLYGYNDFDPFDKVPTYLDVPAYTSFLGQPLSEIPAPEEQGRPLGEVTHETSFARHYASEFEAVYRSLGVESETPRTSELYASGAFNPAIRLALDHAADIRVAYDAAIAHRSADRRGKAPIATFPLSVRCEQCGKLATTEVTAWDGSVVSYHCPTDHMIVPYVAGCGYAGTVSPFDGRAKLPWKVEWAAIWFHFRVDVENAGKDHYTKGGSRDVASEVFTRVFLPALDAAHAKLPEDLFYEWFYLGGKKMSTSRGVGASAKEVADQIPGELLRFLMIRTRPKTAVDFDPNPETIARLFDEYDRVLVAASTDSKSQEAAIMSASSVDDRELPTLVLRFSKIVSLLTHNAKSADEVRRLALEEKGAPLTPSDSDELNRRIAFAQRSVASQPVTTTNKAELDVDQRRFLASLRTHLELLSDTAWEVESLRDRVYAAKADTGIESKRAFQAIYRTLLGTDAGPRVGDLLVREGREHVLTILSALQSE